MCSKISTIDHWSGAGLNFHCPSDNPRTAPIAPLADCSNKVWATPCSYELSVETAVVAVLMIVAPMDDFSAVSSALILTTRLFAEIDGGNKKRLHLFRCSPRIDWLRVRRTS